MLKEKNIKSISNWVIFVVVFLFCIAGVGIIVLQIYDLNFHSSWDLIAFWSWIGLIGAIFLLTFIIIILKWAGKIPSFVVGGIFQVSIIIFAGLAQFGALLMGMEIDSSNTANKDTLFIIFTVVLFGFSFALSLIGYYIGQIIQNKTNVIIKRTVDVVEKKKKHTARDAKKMIKDVADLTGVK